MVGEMGVRSALGSFRDDNESRADLTPNYSNIGVHSEDVAFFLLIQ
jgi:hypothetical protein